MLHHRRKRVGHLTVEFSPRSFLDVGHYFLGGPRIAVGSLRAQSVVHIADMYELARKIAITRTVLLKGS